MNLTASRLATQGPFTDFRLGAGFRTARGSGDGLFDQQGGGMAMWGADHTSTRPLALARGVLCFDASTGRFDPAEPDRGITPDRRQLFLSTGSAAVSARARMEPEAACILVIIGATPGGRKELLGFHVGLRESAQNWRALPIDIKARGLDITPEVAAGDGALGFWKAIDEVFPGARHQRRWFHNLGHECHWSE